MRAYHFFMHPSLHPSVHSSVHPLRVIAVTRHQGTRSVKAGKCEAFTFAGSFFNPHLGRAPEFHVKQTQVRYTKIIKASLIRFLYFLPNLSPLKTVALPGPNAAIAVQVAPYRIHSDAQRSTVVLIQVEVARGPQTWVTCSQVAGPLTFE